MIRRLLIGAVVGLVVLAVAPAAWAKCDPAADPEHGGCVEVTSADVTISGPGLSVPLTISGPPVFDITRQAGFSGFRSSNTDAMDLFPGQAGLGPRYDLHVDIRTETGDTYGFTADLYPYADNIGVPGAPSAWVFFTDPAVIPITERIDGRLFTFGEVSGEAGWWKSSALFYTLAGEGLPSDRPVTVSADDAPAAPSGDGVSAGVRSGLVLASLGALLVVAAFVGRRRSRAIA